MADLTNDNQFTNFAHFSERVSQRGLQATAVKPNTTSPVILFNTDTQTQGPFSLNNNASLTVQSLLENSRNPKYRLGGVPYAIIFLQTSLSTGNIIGSGVTGTYIINGPMAVPTFDPVATSTQVGGNSGANLVYITELINKSGSTQNIYFITNTRVYMPIGGAPVQ